MKKHITTAASVVFLLFMAASLISCTEESRPAVPNTDSQDKLLVFTKTEGYRHASIPDGVDALKAIAAEKGWGIYHTEEALVFNPDSLSAYRAVIFLSTTGNILNETQQEAFKG